MKRLIGCIMIVSVLAMSGCYLTVPDGVKSAIYTAEITADQTVQDVATGQVAPWIIPPDATMEQKLAIRERQVIVLTRILAQIGDNLDAVVSYLRGGKED